MKPHTQKERQINSDAVLRAVWKLRTSPHQNLLNRTVIRQMPCQFEPLDPHMHAGEREEEPDKAQIEVLHSSLFVLNIFIKSTIALCLIESLFYM